MEKFKNKMEDLIKLLIISDLKLISKETGIPYDRMYKWTKGVSNPKLKDYNTLIRYFENGKTSISSIKNYPSSNAIGLGEIIQHDDESPYIDLQNGSFLMVVPKIPIRASAGYRQNYQDDNYVNTQFTKHYFTVPGNHYRGKYFAFVIEGDSMENYTSEEMAKDSIPDGSTATGREIGRQHWKNKFHLKSFQDYIIVHKDAIFAKRITHHDTERGIITCNSLNPDKVRHPDFEIELDECLQILNIVDVSRPR